MFEERENPFEIIDTDNVGFSKADAFSHSNLVMSALRKCHDLGSKEMRTGWFNEKQDRNGNTIRTYVDDTRKCFIESVKSLMMIISCDLDEEAENKIKELKKAINKKRGELIQGQKESWNKLDESDKQYYTQEGSGFIDGEISHPLAKTKLIQFELEIYREIVSEISRLTKRLDFYAADLIEA